MLFREGIQRLLGRSWGAPKAMAPATSHQPVARGARQSSGRDLQRARKATGSL
jgi:hypothetical protein